MGTGPFKSNMIGLLFPSWGKQRSNLAFSKKTFNEMWKEKNNQATEIQTIDDIDFQMTDDRQGNVVTDNRLSDN